MRKAVSRRTKKRRIFFFLAFALLLLVLPFWATLEIYGEKPGCKYFKNYTPKEYGGQTQNWSILQDKRGIIYIGNQIGLLEFDGVSWRRIDLPNDLVRSLAIDDTGIIYVGGKDEIGFLAPDSKGAVQYVSLVEHLDINNRNFSDVWETHWTQQGIYFRTSQFLFRWNPNSKKIDVWESHIGFHISFICRRELFIRQKKIGLMKMDRGSDSLKVIPGGKTFAEKKIYMMVPYDNKKLLIGTRENGFYTYDIYDGIEAVPFPTEADNYFKENQLSHGIRLSSGDFALATLRGGLVIIDSRGRLNEIFNKAYGLQDDNVKYFIEDFQGNLWLAMDRGISKIEYVSPLSIYDDRSNLPGSVLSVTRHNKDLYAGTSRGLFFLASPNVFRPTAGISSNCWSLISIEDSLLAATTNGVFQVENNNKRIVLKNPSYVLLPSQMDSNRIWVGTREGLVSLYSKGENKNRKWKKEHQFENITPQIRTIVEDKEGNLWLGTKTKGVLKVDFPGKVKVLHPVVNWYHSSHGLPPGSIRVYTAAGHVMFATDKGIFRFDEVNKRFIPDFTLGEEFADGSSCSRGVFRILEDKNKNVWVHSDSRNFQAILQPDGASTTFVINEKPFLRIPDVQVNTIYPDPDGRTTWFASNGGLIRFDTRVKKNYDYDFPTLIRKVLVNGNLVFAGYQYNKYKIDKDSKNLLPIFDYQDKNFIFEFAAPFFEAETMTQYQCFLEGYENDWSDWNRETKKDYLNIDPGLYTFRVRAKNVYGHLGSEAAFQFKILLPWYRTWWAFLCYALVFFMLTYLVVRWRRSFKLEQEKRKLEQIVIERTKEVNDRNKQLVELSEKLKEIDKVKSRFFANISHEFRTPLTLIMGPLEQMLSGDIENETEQRKKLALMLRNSHRLLGLINQLLELSKFESGKMKLQACRQNIIPFLKGCLASFDPVANKNELDLTFHAEEQNITLYFDPGNLEQALFNLLSNAVKFTPAGGKITVTATKDQAKTVNFPSGFVEISVCDTGPGIPRDQLAHIFDRFYQSDSTYEHHQKGSGIGLAIAKELVELHHGEIKVRNVEGEGTEFIIRLPMGDSHLRPEEIVQPSVKPHKYKSIEEIPALDMMEKERGVPVDEKGVPADVKAGTVNSKETSVTEEKDVELEVQEKNIILVVEDSADFRDYIRGCLEPLYEVVEAKDGREGMQKAQKVIPDLIISDIMMPEVDGYALCRVLKKDIKTSHIPIILLTAKVSEENIVKGLETGADDYITKPFSTKILCARIKNLIDLRRHLQLTRKRQMTLQPAEISVSSVDEQFYKELEDVIEKNLSDSEFNVEKLGKKLYMSRATLYRKIMALTGESPLQFIRSYRLKRAAQLLKANFGNVTEVAVEVGFSNIAHFSQCFKEEFHQLPSTFQASEAE
ncbi:MAG: response regulator [Candidatus Aminicenantes bacterium]|nr:MAG: response regulator [Candidatus Aminicenantes bacterium]